MNDSRPTGDEGNPFRSIAYLLYEKKISPAAMATAIEREGVYTWDRFGRYILATDGKADDQASKACILHSVGNYYDQERLSNLELNYIYDPEFIYATLLDQYDDPLNTFGWTSKEIPDFAALLKESEQLNAPRRPRKEPAPQSAVARLIKGLIVLNYGESMIEGLNKEKSDKLSEIKCDLELKGFKFDNKTLRKYLKHLPD